MKKYEIGVVTFFDAYNYGAIFQTYALQVFLNNINISSCIVKYSWHPEERINSLKGLAYWLLHCRKIKKKREAFKSFLADCNYTVSCNSDNVNEINNECERFVVGSDQVWNSKWNYNSNVFYLTFSNQKFSYAASFGSVSSITKYREKIIKDDLSIFNAISVREKSAQTFLKTLGIESRTNIDPVFLLKCDEWINKTEKNKYGRYILIYSLENNGEMLNFAKELALKKGVKLLIVSDTNKKKIFDINTVRYPSPEKFLTLFYHAEAIVTNSFHGAAFSIVFNKQFYSFLQKSKSAPNDRIIDLLDDCELSSRIVNDSFKDKECNFEKANAFIEKERKKAAEYLHSINKGEFDHSKVSNSDSFKTRYFYAKAKDKKIISNSRSGGVSFLLGQKYLENNGIVYGAILDDDYTVNIQRVIDNTTLEKTQNSKYVSSNIKKTFVECENDLLDNKKVFYSALPCQISGLLMYLKHKNIDTKNLLTADIVCHGTPEEQYFKEYINYLCGKYKNHISNFNFRDKEYGWDTHFESFFVDGKKIKSNMFSRFFYSNYGLKSGCYNCPFSNFDRNSDITLCDAWGYIEKGDEKNGANLVMINTKKGLNAITELSEMLDERQIDRLEFIQPNLMGPSEKPHDYEKVISLIKGKDFDFTYKKTTKDIIKNERKNRNKRRVVKFLRVFRIR